LAPVVFLLAYSKHIRRTATNEPTAGAFTWSSPAGDPATSRTGRTVGAVVPPFATAQTSCDN